MSENVRVAVRVRPFNSREKAANSKNCIRMDGPQTIIRNPADNAEKPFTFDYSYDSFVPRDDPSYASQTIVFNDLGVGVLENAFKGFNVSLFAYGQTGAGKSYSMMGYGPDKGIIPIASEDIFRRIDEQKTEEKTFKVEASMMEIYNEKVRDLFNPTAGGAAGLKVRDNPKIGPYVQNLTKNAVDSYPKIEKLMELGTAARTVASTNMNSTSSRAHTVFQINFTQTTMDPVRQKATDKVSLINLIDLAGSERAQSTGATGDRLKEGCAINQSLSALGNCISTLASNAGKPKKRQKHVPYRNSVLTHLLKNSLGGNAKTIMIAAVSPADINYEESLGTLRYADRAKQIKNTAVINEDPNEKMIRGLKEELAKLKAQLAEGGGGGAPMPPPAAGAAGGGGGGGADEEALKAQWEKQKAEEMEKLRAQMAENERLLKEQAMSWEERLKQTEASSSQNQAALAAAGVTTQSELGRIKEQQLTHAHMMNLNEDPLMTGILVYFMEPGITRFGRSDAETKQDVNLNGLSIQKEHCIVENKNNEQLFITPMAGAKVHVNGKRVPPGDSWELHHSSRVIFGNNHVYLAMFPAAAHSNHALSEGEVKEETAVHSWQFAMQEINAEAVSALTAGDEQATMEAEREMAAMQARVAELEMQLGRERKTAEESLEAELVSFEAAMAAFAQRQEEVIAAGGDEAAVAEAQAKINAEQTERQSAYEEKKAEIETARGERERELKEQIAKAHLVAKKREKERRDRGLLDEQLIKTIPLVNEANAISDELSKAMTFGIKLMASQSRSQMSITVDGREETADVSSLETEVALMVEYTDESQPRALWGYDKFTNRLYLMREMYQKFVECGRDAQALGYSRDDDPFFDPPQARLVGRALIYMDSLSYLLEIEEATPIIDYKGKQEGELLIALEPVKLDGRSLSDDVDVEEHRLENYVGRTLTVAVRLMGARGLPQNLCKDVYVSYKFFNQAERRTDEYPQQSINPRFNYNCAIDIAVDQPFITHISNEAMEFEVWGKPEDPMQSTEGGIGGGAAAAAGAGSGAAAASTPRGPLISNPLRRGGGGGGGGAPQTLDDAELVALRREVEENRLARERAEQALDRAKGKMKSLRRQVTSAAPGGADNAKLAVELAVREVEEKYRDTEGELQARIAQLEEELKAKPASSACTVQ